MKKFFKVITIIVVVVTLVIAVYIMARGLGLLGVLMYALWKWVDGRK